VETLQRAIMGLIVGGLIFVGRPTFTDVRIAITFSLSAGG
jgi:hypothetical protein